MRFRRWLVSVLASVFIMTSALAGTVPVLAEEEVQSETETAQEETEEATEQTEADTAEETGIDIPVFPEETETGEADPVVMSGAMNEDETALESEEQEEVPEPGTVEESEKEIAEEPSAEALEEPATEETNEAEESEEVEDTEATEESVTADTVETVKEKAIVTKAAATLLGDPPKYYPPNPYPKWYDDDEGIRHPGNCTFQAWQECYETLGIQLPEWGNGGQWAGNAIASGYKYLAWTGSTVPANVILENSHHVAWVKSVDSSGVIIVDGNIDMKDGNGYQERVERYKTWAGFQALGYPRFIDPVNHIVYYFLPHAPLGKLDSISADGEGNLHITGWCFDPDAPAQLPMLHVYVGGGVGTGANGYAAQANSTLRADVENTYGPVGAYHGFDLVVPVQERGDQEVHVYIIDIGGGDSPEIFSGVVNLGTVNQKPKGEVKVINGSNGKLHLEGWAFDPDHPAVLLTIHVYVGGGVGTGAKGYSFKTNEVEAREVETMYGPVGMFHGFNVDIPVTERGRQEIHVYAIDTEKGDSPEIYLGTVSITEPPVAVTGVTLNAVSFTLNKGASQRVAAAITPSNAADKSVSWSSSNTSVATVDSNGVVTARNPGTAVITVRTTDGGMTASCAVTVPNTTVAVTGVTLNKSSLSLKKGASEKLTATIAPSNSTDKSVTWSSSNTSAATVASDGTVTAKAKGTSTITVRSNNGGKTASCTVTVMEDASSGSGSSSASPSAKNGWYYEDGKYVWYENGVKQGTTGRGKEIYFSGASNLNNPGRFPAGWYWLDAIQGGARAVSKDVYQESEAGKWAGKADGTGKWVRYDAYGQMIKGWQTVDGKTYYFDRTFGTMAKGYASIEETEYYFDPVTGVLLKNLGSVPQNGWKNIDGKDYWYENCDRQGVSIDGSYRGKEIFFSGQAGIANPSRLPAGWYWLDNVYGGAKAANKEVYMPYTINGRDNIGKWVRYDGTGQMIKGWYDLNGKRYYYNVTTGAMLKGNQVIDGRHYYFDETTGALR